MKSSRVLGYMRYYYLSVRVVLLRLVLLLHRAGPIAVVVVKCSGVGGSQAGQCL